MADVDVERDDIGCVVDAAKDAVHVVSPFGLRQVAGYGDVTPLVQRQLHSSAFRAVGLHNDEVPRPIDLERQLLSRQCAGDGHNGHGVASTRICRTSDPEREGPILESMQDRCCWPGRVSAVVVAVEGRLDSVWCEAQPACTVYPCAILSVPRIIGHLSE